MTATGQKKLAFTAKVMAVFTEVQKSPSMHKTHIFQLAKLAEEDVQLFMYSFEQSYLKIFHSFHIKSNRKIPTKFETLAESLFQMMLSKSTDTFSLEDSQNRSLEIFNSFLLLCTEGIYSSIMNIRIMCSRVSFMLVKLIPAGKMDFYLNDEVQRSIVNSTLHLIRTKVSTYRQLGIKLASLIMHVSSQHCQNIEKEMFKILAVEDNEQIRKLVITNLTITTHNLDEVLIRLRDKNLEIRSIVPKKLQGERFKLQNMTISNLYKLLYDGYGSKEILVRKQCLRYFAMYFLPTPNTMEDQTKRKQEEFVKMFRPDILLLNPHLYQLFNQLIIDLLEEVEQYMTDYLRQSCNALKRGHLNCEIIWLKNSINSNSAQIRRIYEEYGPSGVDLAKILSTLAINEQAFAMFELLQLFGLQKMPEQIGRNKMFDALKELLSKLHYFQIKPDYSNFKDTDICHIPYPQQIIRKKLMLSYYDMPIISISFDLIFQIGQAMKNLRPGHYEIEMKQVMSEWNSLQENTLYKERQLLEKNIEQLKAKNNKSILQNMLTKLKQIQEKIEQQKQKTRKVLICISRLRYNCDLEMFMSIIKDELSREDKANGLLLLGLYCLENQDKVSNFWAIFWKYIEKKEFEKYDKNHLLVSLKVVIDFIVKFNCLEANFVPETSQDFSADLFMNQMMRLMLHEDSDIRILAIQSLCRLLYHQKIDKNNETTYFILLILLWLETSHEVVSAKSVHTVSIFIKAYMEKGNLYSQKLSQFFCQFFQVILKFHNQKMGINKALITYNLTMEEFFKKTIFTVMTIFKYQKESKNVIWTYNSQESQIGPQQFLLMYFLKEDQLIPYLGKTLALADFFEFCCLETLIMVKKLLEELTETRRWKGQIEQSIKKLQSDIQIQISLKNSEIYNSQILSSMQREYVQKMKLLSEQSIYVHKNIKQKKLFIPIDYNSEDEESNEDQISSESDSLNGSLSSQMNEDDNLERRKKEVVISISESQNQQQKQDESGQKEVFKKRGRQKKLKIEPAPLRELRKKR